MNWGDVSRMKAISQNRQEAPEKSRSRFVSQIRSYLQKRGHRADLKLIVNSKNTHGRFPAEVRYNTRLGAPSEKDLMSLVNKHFAQKDIEWETMSTDTGSGVITIYLEPAVEVVPLENINQIPSEFKPIGTGLYKRAADLSGNVNEIWTLSKTKDGLGLFRKQDDIEVVADDEDQFKAGSIVDTPHGPGKIHRFDDHGNAIVLIGNKKKLVAANDLRPYKVEKEKTKLRDYFRQMYGDSAFADALVQDYGDKK